MTATVTTIHPKRFDQAPDGHITAAVLCARSGLTYQQRDFWTRCGLLEAVSDWYPVIEAAVAAVALALIECGFTLRPAVELARRIVAGESVSLADGLVRLAPPETA
jgi:hypothetical protein